MWLGVGGRLALRVKGGVFAWSAPREPVYAPGKHQFSGRRFSQIQLVLLLLSCPVWLPFWTLHFLCKHPSYRRHWVAVIWVAFFSRS